jgi:hypothetical protein
MDLVLAKSLYIWARKNPDNYSKLENWLEDAVTAIAEGKGSQVQSTTANGVSVSFATNSLTVADWFNTLSQAIQFIDSPPVSKIRGRVN